MPGSVEQESGITIKAEVLAILATPEGATMTLREICERVGRGDRGAIGRIVREFRQGITPVAPADVREIPLASIVVDDRVPFRDHVDPAAVDDYAEVWRAGDAKFPPVVVFRDGTTDYLGGGLHRYLSAVQAGMAAIRAEVREGTLRDAILFAAGDNKTNGIRKTAADRRAGVLALLADPECAGWSAERIAEHCGVSIRTVGRCRQEASGDQGSANGRPAESEPTAAIAEQDDSQQPDASDPVEPADDGPSADRALDCQAEGDIDDSMGANPEDDPDARMRPSTEDEDEAGEVAGTASANGHPAGTNGTATAPAVAGEMTDDEWLATLTVRDKLAPASLKGFDADALLYRHLKESDPYGPFDRRAKKLLDAKKIKRTGPFWSKLSTFLRIPHPRDWKACLNCRATGMISNVGQCSQCHGDGFLIV